MNQFNFEKKPFQCNSANSVYELSDYKTNFLIFSKNYGNSSCETQQNPHFYI